MKIVKQTVTHIPQPTSNHAQWLERIGRVCYKSEDKITENSAEKFLDMLIKNGHTSIFEHLQLIFKYRGYNIWYNSKFAKIDELYVSANFRAILDCGVPNISPLDYFEKLVNEQITNEEKQREKTYLANNSHFVETFHIVTDRATSHELVRHRTGSFTQESTRFINYKKKFSDIEFIQPIGLFNDELVKIWKDAMRYAQVAYDDMITLAKPEIARSVLPHSTKTELYMTCRLKDWKHFLDLRLSPKASPQIRDIAEKIQIKLKEKYTSLF